jgi:hypothetical protein
MAFGYAAKVKAEHDLVKRAKEAIEPMMRTAGLEARIVLYPREDLVAEMTPAASMGDTAIKEHPARAIDVCQRIAMICDFIETIKQDSVEKHVPVCMPADVGSLGFDTHIWVGLGMVGLWAGLDAFAERAELKKPKCAICDRTCIASRFASYTQGNEGKSLQELEDLRHLYAHNYVGNADEKYFERKRHVLQSGVETKLTCDTSFNGRQASLNLTHLRMYSQTAKAVLERIPERVERDDRRGGAGKMLSGG